MEEFRNRQLNDRPSALEAKYDPKEFLDGYVADAGVAASIEKLQKERGLSAGDRALKGGVGMDIGSPERMGNYM